MKRNAGKQIPRLRSGFTLVEMLIVMTVLVIIAGIVLPIMSDQYNEYRLENAATVVHEEFANARTHAVDTGLAYQFRFEPNGRRYLIIPAETDADDANAGQGNGDGTEPYRPRVAQSLPDGFEFSIESTDNGTTPNIETEQIPESLLAGLPDANELAGVSWSPAIMFYPDGTSQSAQFIIKDSRKQFVRFSVRELTGAVSVSPVKMEAR
ncbi:MAG: hypothetical protein Tsb009_23770 [Planctomycetaceae bacterium]